MANDADNIVIGASGSVNFAPVGSVGPTSPTAALDLAFVDAGYLTPDGVSFAPGMEVSEVPAWQSQYPVRRFITTRSFDVSFTMLEMTKANFLFAMGGGAISTSAPTATPPNVSTFTPPVASEIDERALVVAWKDGAKSYRLHVPRGMVSDTGEVTLQREDASGLAVTFSVLATDDVAAFSIISDDPAWA